VQGVNLDDQTLLAKHLEGLIYGVKGDGRHVPLNFLVNLFGCGVIAAGLQIRQYRQALRSHGYVPGP
jgi:hypothetical protein